MTVQRTHYVDADALEPSVENVLGILRGDITPVRADLIVEGDTMTEPRDPEAEQGPQNDPVPEPAGPEPTPEDDGSTPTSEPQP